VTGEWITEACTEIRLNSPTTLEKPSVSRIAESDGSMTLWCKSNPECAKTEFVVNGVRTAADHITLSADAASAVAVRQYDKDGGYVSTLYDDVRDIPEQKPEITVTGSEIAVSATPDGAILTVAVFDADGRLLAADSCPVSGSQTKSFADFDVALSKGGTVKVFLFAADGITPLCEAQSVRVSI